MTKTNVSFIIGAAEKAGWKLGLEKHWLNNHTAIYMPVLFSN